MANYAIHCDKLEIITYFLIIIRQGRTGHKSIVAFATWAALIFP